MRETVIRVHRAPRPRPPSPVSLLSRSNTAHLARRVSSHVSPRHERHATGEHTINIIPGAGAAAPRAGQSLPSLRHQPGGVKR